MDLKVVILAAGQGKRMHSDLPKVLQPLGGRPLLAHVLDTATALDAARIQCVYGHGGDAVPGAFPDAPVEWILQAEQLGTGHAVAQAMPGIPDEHTVLVLFGDVPLLTVTTLQRLLEAAGNGVGVLTVESADPSGYGRILRNDAGDVAGIVEERDASDSQRRIREINTGIMVLPAAKLRGWLQAIDNDNSQGEYYLTDAIARAVADGVPVHAVSAGSEQEVAGVNDRGQLAALERAYQRRRAEALMAAGVTLLDPGRFDVRGQLECGRDVSIDVNCVFEGNVKLGDGVSVGPHCVVRDTVVGPGSVIAAHSMIEDAAIGRECRIGPFARIRPGTELADTARVGNFVEVKNARFAPGAKANHLAYVGDAEVGAGVNIGAGTITCNYDGANKHTTVIGDGAFIGSNTSLVAPVRIGAGATIGAGSVISKDAPAGELTLERSSQQTIKGWSRPGSGDKED